MKRTLKLREEEFIGLVQTILEQINLDDYEDTDFVDVFIYSFRQWLQSEIGDNVKKYPMSLLLKKFGKKFIKYYIFDGDEDIDDDDEYISHYDLSRWGKKIVEKQKYQLPGLYPERKFTEKYSKALEPIVKSLDLPDYITLEFVEEVPYRVDVKVNVNFPQMMASKEPNNQRSNNIENNLTNYLTNFLGVEFGNPAHGELHLSVNSFEHVGLEAWTKNVFNKVLKKEIKQLPHADEISRMVLEIKERRATLKIYFKSDNWRFSYTEKRELIKKIEEFLKKKGYGPNLHVELM
jgi:hypothetical protein